MTDKGKNKNPSIFHAGEKKEPRRDALDLDVEIVAIVALVSSGPFDKMKLLLNRHLS